MDIKEYIAILKAEKKFFWLTTVLLWFSFALWQAAQPIRYEANLLLTIGRTTAPEATEYTYDDFYRLQADERFGDTLVKWLHSPRIVSDILESAGVASEQYSQKDLAKVFVAKRLSSQIVEVVFVAENRLVLEQYAEGIKEVTDKYTSALSGGDAGWFRVVSSDPVIRDGRVPAWPFLIFAFGAALFASFWLSLAHYFFTGTHTPLTKEE